MSLTVRTPAGSWDLTEPDCSSFLIWVSVCQIGQNCKITSKLHKSIDPFLIVPSYSYNVNWRQLPPLNETNISTFKQPADWLLIQFWCFRTNVTHSERRSSLFQRLWAGEIQTYGEFINLRTWDERIKSTLFAKHVRLDVSTPGSEVRKWRRRLFNGWKIVCNGRRPPYISNRRRIERQRRTD